MQSINAIHTSCKSCVFAEYDKNTQIGCALDYIKKYKNKNTEILEAYDLEKEFYVINSKKCLGYRENKWFEKYDLHNSTLDQKIEKFKELNHINYLLVINLKNFDLKGLNELGEAIKNCYIKPEKIIFIRHQTSKIFTYDIIKDFFEKIKIDCIWRIQTMIDGSMSNSDILHSIVNLNKSHRFILSINKESEDINILINTANKIVYENLDTFIALRNTNQTAVLFSAPSYRWSIFIENKNILNDETNYITV